MKAKTAFLAAIVLIICQAAYATNIALNFEGKDAIVSPEGDIIVPPEKYDRIYPLGEKFFALGVAESGDDGLSRAYYALGDEMGEPVTNSLYESLEYRDGVIYFTIDGRWGAMNESLETLVPCEYTFLSGDGEGGFLGFITLRTDPTDTAADEVYAYSQTSGERDLGMTVADVGIAFSGGLLPAMSEEQGLYGYLNAFGDWAISPRFRYAGDFEGGLARAAGDNGLGLIDESGEWVLACEYDTLEISDGIVLACSYGRGAYIMSGENFEVIKSFEGEGVYASLKGDFALILDCDKLTLYDRTGSPRVSAPAGGGIEAFITRAAVFEREYEAYLCDLYGSRLAGPFNAIYSAGLHSGREYFIEVAYDMDGGYADLASARFYLLDDSGARVCETGFAMLYRVSENRFFARTDEARGMIDSGGNWLVSFES